MPRTANCLPEPESRCILLGCRRAWWWRKGTVGSRFASMPVNLPERTSWSRVLGAELREARLRAEAPHAPGLPPWDGYWVQANAESMPDELRALILLETTATQIDSYQPHLIPGLAQTEPYTCPLPRGRAHGRRPGRATCPCSTKATRAVREVGSSLSVVLHP
ncbi:Scr1 family TA system antitoxin-like transcriptional regulator [Actinokineospora sp. UTMC 2448]|uniref:Scr1 family TA system antitoxin-like transcriptional regulator n=1 Tax=Actinokineospora sp. UTMC 2448 TaxID=2268449 RepID=UPI0037C00BEB